jgi:hypothetical protein
MPFALIAWRLESGFSKHLREDSPMTDRPTTPGPATFLTCALLAAATGLAPACARADNVRLDGSVATGEGRPGCQQLDAKSCVAQSIEAMGGRDRLEAIRNVRYQTIGHTLVTEQSYRQQPFFTAYQHDTLTIDFAAGRTLDVAHLTWPESDPHQFEIDQTLVATPTACVYRAAAGDTPCALSDLDQAGDALALGPERLLLTAAQAVDLHYESPRWLRDTRHAAVTFTWHGVATTVLLNATNHLPDAMARTRTFQDFWYAWGDVRQLVYFDNWHLVGGVVMPTNRVEARNGIVWQSTQAVDIAFNVDIDGKRFAMDPAVAAKAAQSPGWDRTFKDKAPVTLAPGILLYQASWNTTLIRQDDGVLILEAPISGTYARGVIAKARSEFPGLPIKGVLSTSDSWPHVAGVRQAVAEGLPVWALDLNLRELDDMARAPHALHPDDLQKMPAAPRWNVVAGRLEVGRGDNRAELYPLRGASTERQYMVYFPKYRLLYASDTLALNADQSLYDPQLMHEVMQAVERNSLAVDTVFAMHEGPRPWKDVVKLVQASQG